MKLADPGPALTTEEIAEFEGEVGRPLPRDYKQFLLRYNGGRPDPPLGFRLNDDFYEINKLFRLLQGRDRGLRSALESVRRIEIGDGYLGIAIAGDESEFVCLSLDAGSVWLASYLYDRDGYELGATLLPVSDSFSEFVERLVPANDENEALDEMAWTNSRAVFPFEQWQISRVEIRSDVRFNSGVPPRLRWYIDMRIDATTSWFPHAPTKAAIILSDLELGIADWHELPGAYEFESTQNAALHVGNGQIAMLATELIITAKSGTLFEVAATVNFLNDIDGIADTLRLQAPASYEGFRFSVADWVDPSAMDFPPEWHIPSKAAEWTDEQFLEFVGRFIEFSRYGAPEIEDHRYFKASPRVR